MPFPQGITPSQTSLRVRRGMTLRRIVIIYEDIAGTKPLSLVGWTAELFIPGYPLTLKSGSGLTLTPSTGEIAVLMTPEQTSKAPAESLHYYLTLEESATEKVEVLEGTIIFGNN